MRPPNGSPAAVFRERPLEFLAELHDRHGDVVTADLDGVPTVVCGGATGAMKLFRAERGNLEVYNTELVHELFGDTVFNLYGEQHKAARSALLAGLHRRRMPDLLPSVVAVAARHVSALPEGPFDLHSEALAVTISACAEVILGIPATDPDGDVLRTLFAAFAEGTRLPPDTPQSDPTRRAALAAADQLRVLFEARLQRVRANPDGGFLATADEVLGRSAVSAGQMPDHLLAVLIATRETTAALITWLLRELAEDTTSAQALAREATALVASPALLVDRTAAPRLRAAMLEAERLHSPNAISTRTVVRGCRIGGYDVPVGWRAAYSPAADHLRGALHRDPQQFRPERFTGSPPESRSADLLTFGGGLHGCPGRHLAELLTLAFASAVLAGHRLVPLGSFPTDLLYLPVKAPRGAVLVRREAVEVPV